MKSRPLLEHSLVLASEASDETRSEGEIRHFFHEKWC